MAQTSDHLNAKLLGALGLEGTAKPGAFIEIQEAMQYLKYGWKYPVNNKLKIFCCDSDGWAMGKQVPAHRLGYDKALFDVRLEGYRKTGNPHQHHGFADPTFLAWLNTGVTKP